MWISCFNPKPPLAKLLLVVAITVLCTSDAIGGSDVHYYKHRIDLSLKSADWMVEQTKSKSGQELRYLLVEMGRSIGESLPKHEIVDIDGNDFLVDNSWLHFWLKEIIYYSDDKQAAAGAEEMRTYLKSLQSHFARIEEAVRSEKSDKEKLKEILSRPEFVPAQKGEESLWARMNREISKWLEDVLPKRSPFPNTEPSSERGIFIFQTLLYSAFGLTVVFVIVRYGRRISEKFRRKNKDADGQRVVLGELIKENETARDVFAEAEAFAAAGELKTAVRKAYIAMLCEFGDRRIVRIAKHKTNRDYLREIKIHGDLYGRASALTDGYERHWYGFEPTTESDWEKFRREYLELMS